MAHVLPLEDLRRSEIAALFEGERHGDGVALSFFATEWPPGRGPVLHLHPYAEVFIVRAGEAVFSVDGTDTTVTAGHVVVVPPETPHRYRNEGDGTLEVLSMHPSPRVVQTDLDA